MPKPFQHDIDSTPKKKKDGNVFFFIFGLVFFLAGLAVFIKGAIPVYKSYQAENWQEHYATINNVEQIISYDDEGSATYGVKGKFSYTYNQQPHQSSQFSFVTGTDNIGSYQQDLYSALNAQHQANQQIKIYVNPAQPSEAVYDKNIRWGLFAFHSMFLLAFGGVGIGAMFGGRFIKKESKKEKELQTLYPNQPWKWKNEWHSNRINYDNKVGFWAVGIFALIWNLISTPTSIMVLTSFTETKDYFSLLVLLFPLVGLFMIGLTFYVWRSGKKFAGSFLEIDSIPLKIGELNRGHISVPANAMLDDEVLITISCIRTIKRNDDKDIDILWQSNQRVMPQAGINDALESHFSFHIPGDLPESNDQNARKKIHWEIKVEQELKGVDLNLIYEAPVFKLNNASTEKNASTPTETLPERYVSTQANTPHINLGDYSKLKLQESLTNDGTRFYFPAAQMLGNSIISCIFGAAFTAAGTFLHIKAEAPLVFAGIFTLIGLAVFIWGVRSLLYRSEIITSYGKLQYRSGHLFMGNLNTVSTQELSRIKIHSSMTSNDTKIYDLQLELNDKRTITLAKYLTIDTDIQALIQQMYTNMGFKEKHKPNKELKKKPNKKTEPTTSTEQENN